MLRILALLALPSGAATAQSPDAIILSIAVSPDPVDGKMSVRSINWERRP